jgi:Aromatic acid exporter family member 2
MILPPKSARKAVRRGSAKTLTSLSNIYASLMSAWITDIPSSKELKSGLSIRASSFRKDLAAVALQLQNLRETARWARWEGNVRGRWPYEEYNRLVDVQLDMVAVLAQVSRISIQVRSLDDSEKKLASALSELDDEWRLGFLHHGKVVNPNFVRTSFGGLTFLCATLMSF